jgi:2-methylisocitrate lyase-like PEP mutase family enzyme
LIAVDQIEDAEHLASLHVKGSPLALYNAWDAGSANAIREGGAPAIATSSWASPAEPGAER